MADRDGKVPSRKSQGRSGGAVDAPGKRHRTPPPTERGVKHSNETLAKARLAEQVRKRGRG
jgi:hypothetical protein